MSRLRTLRSQKGWSQAELSRRSGVSRSSIAAIETGALVPSVNAALALARSLDCTVEAIFGETDGEDISWAWRPVRDSLAYWKASVGERQLAFPIESLPYTLLPPDGILEGPSRKLFLPDSAKRTLVMASCDPAVGLLAAMMTEKTGVRLISFHRSSREALTLLKEGVIHVAGTHLREIHEPGGNSPVIQETLGKGYCLLRGAVWHDGVAVRPGEGLKTLKATSLERVRWIGRKEGSGARRCQDKVLPVERAPERIAQNHWEVAMAVRQGWVDAGVCHQIAAEHAGLEFLQVSREVFDFCYPEYLAHDPRIEALRRVVQSPFYRKLLSSFKGLEIKTTGVEETV